MHITIRSEQHVVCHGARSLKAVERFSAERVGPEVAAQLAAAAGYATRHRIQQGQALIAGQVFSITRR
jgi:hypothetical protein